MRIVRGFTLIELLVIMGIIGILAVMTAPNFLLMQNRVKFQEDAQKFLDILGEARSNALSNKKCENGQDSLKWTVLVRRFDPVINIYCQSADNIAAIQINESNYELSSHVRIYRLESAQAPATAWFSGATAPYEYFGVSYFSGTGQAKLESFTPVGTYDDVTKATFDAGTVIAPWSNANGLNGVRRSTFRLVFEWAAENEKITICMNAIAGYPRVSKDGTDDCSDE